MANQTRGLTLGRTAAQADPHRSLACAVLWQAVLDARAERTAALLWLHNGADGLLDALDLDRDAVLRTAERRTQRQPA